VTPTVSCVEKTINFDEQAGNASSIVAMQVPVAPGGVSFEQSLFGPNINACHMFPPGKPLDLCKGTRSGFVRWQVLPEMVILEAQSQDWNRTADARDESKSRHVQVCMFVLIVMKGVLGYIR